MPAWMHDTVEERTAPLEPVTRLAKLILEPTSRCNLLCRTCMRNAWQEPSGEMSRATFERVIEGLRALAPPPEVLFGGIGEPLFHPEIVPMVAGVKELAARVELITNGTLLDDTRADGLIAAGLDTLWVSLDGATPESYTDVRLGAALPAVLDHLTRLRDRPGAPEIGIVFVALRRSIGELPALLRLARTLGAVRFMVTNVLPYTPDMCGEVLYGRALSNGLHQSVPDLPDLSLPHMDRGALDAAALLRSWGAAPGTYGGQPPHNRCPFVAQGALAVGWDGGASPCVPLLHSVTSYLHGCERRARRWTIGSVHQHSLADLWATREHVAFRARVRDFDFSPCALCDGCRLSETNEEDCYGNGFPTCGGCLWAQGVIQCP